MIRSRTRTALAAAAAALVLAACGGADDAGDTDAAAAADGVVAVVGTDSLAWDQESFEVPAGEITVELTCEDAVNHNFVIDETGEEVVACDPGETATGTVSLEAGTYTYVCTIPGHETTMRGELTVS